MTEKEKVEEALQNIINNIEEFEGGDGEWYAGQITANQEEVEEYGDCRSTDQYFMQKAFKYPELHPLMRDVVEIITETNASVGEMWDEDEEHAGTNAALQLALANIEDVPLYAYFIATNDLNHPVYQEEDWSEVFDRWGECEETLLLLIVIALIPGQYFGTDDYWDDFATFIRKDENIDMFFRQLHFFLLRTSNNDLDIYIRDVEKFLNDKLPMLLPDEMASDEGLVSHIVKQFLDYPEVPEEPTLEILKSGYKK